MDSQTIKITMFLGISVFLALIIFLAMGVTKDVAAAASGKIGMKTPGDDDRTFILPGTATAKLVCERGEEQLKLGQFLYKIEISDAKIQSDYKGGIRPVLYFKSSLIKAKEGIIPKDNVISGNIPPLHFELPTVSAPTYTTEDFVMWLLKADNKQCEAALAGAINENILVEQCSRALLAKFDATSVSCARLPSIKLESVETKTEKGVKKCSPVFKVINNDNFDWSADDGYSIVIRNCFPEKNPPDNDLWRPKMEDNPRFLIGTTFIRSYEILKGQSITENSNAYCTARPGDFTIELYKGCNNIKAGSASCYCVNKYQGVDNYKNGECKNRRDDPLNKNLNPPVLVDPEPVSFKCQP